MYLVRLYFIYLQERDVNSGLIRYSLYMCNSISINQNELINYESTEADDNMMFNTNEMKDTHQALV